MFTQCTNCQAIFRVSMREVTVSKGFMRCGECLEIFDSSKSISTTMQKPFETIELEEKLEKEELSENNFQTISTLDDWQRVSRSDEDSTKDSEENTTSLSTKAQKTKPKIKRNPLTTKGVEKVTFEKIEESKKPLFKGKLSFVIAALLALLLIAQIAINYQHVFFDKLKYKPEKILMLNHNVFAHPIEKNVLLISASIENTADFDQPFPVLEVRLTNSKAQLVALRRFSPNEYLDNYTSDKLLAKKRPTSIKLKIQDPGSQATRFQFDFL